MVPQRSCPDLWVVSLTGETHLKLRAVISCQHAVKDNCNDSQSWPTEVIEVVNQAWLKRVFSRPDPQEPEKGLPGLAEENPNRPLERERPRTRVVCRDGRFAHRGLLKKAAVCQRGRFAHRRLLKTVAVCRRSRFAHRSRWRRSRCAGEAVSLTEGC